MDSRLYLQVFSSLEVIVASLVLIFLLPLVFFIASTRSRRKFVRDGARSRKTRPVRRTPGKEAAPEKQEDPEALPGPRRRPEGPADDADDPG